MVFTLYEIIDIIIISLVVGYIFKDFIKVKHHASYHDDPIKFYQQKKRSSNFKTAILVTAPAIILHELGHKFVAIGFGMFATLKAAYEFLILGLILKMLNFGFIFFVPAYVTWGCPTKACQTYLLANPWVYSLIAFAGPLVNGAIWLICYFVIKSPKTRPKYIPILALIKRINGFLFILNMIPVGYGNFGFDGWYVFKGLIYSII